jgi:N-acetylglucosamine kinase-like BadF-type ATPase
MPLYLGIDAGGTKTDCAISNGAELLGQATGASCKLARVGKEKGRENLHGVIRQVCEAAKVSPQDIQHVCIGMAGASMAEAVHWAQQTIRELMPDATIYVAGDHVIAHRAAFGTTPGVLVISGTGSISFGRNQSGETARAGGWGPNVSDEGSAFWVGREAVIEALRDFDFGRTDGLLTTIADSWKVAPEEVIRLANASEPRFAELAGSLIAAAEQGNAKAQCIALSAGKALAELGSAVIKRLWPNGGIVPVALSGGVLQNSPLVRQAFKDTMKVEQPQAAVSFAYVRPVLGALEIAAQRGGRR